MYSARSKGSHVYSLPSVQVVGSGCITLSQQVALQPKKQEKGQEKGVPGGLISWGPADGGWGGIQREGSSPGHTSASHAHTGRHTQHLTYVHNQGSTLHGAEAFPYKFSLNPHNGLMGSANVIPLYR